MSTVKQLFKDNKMLDPGNVFDLALIPFYNGFDLALAQIHIMKNVGDNWGPNEEARRDPHHKRMR